MDSRSALRHSPVSSGPLGGEGGGVHLRGGSSIGKSTIMELAGSVWGGGGIRGFSSSWRSTDNALEATAVSHSDALLCLDEIGEADPRTVGAIAYMLANGIAKGRATRSGGARKIPTWRVLFLSTGEISLLGISEDSEHPGVLPDPPPCYGAHPERSLELRHLN